MKLTSQMIKDKAKELGIDCIAIGNIERFKNAPKLMSPLTYFPEAKISLVRKEIDVMELTYDVIFTDGTKVEFDRKGNWTEVDCLTHPLPSGIVPEAIEKVIRTQYPEAQATKIERDHREFDVKLNNRVELTFNKNMQLVDID